MIPGTTLAHLTFQLMLFAPREEAEPLVSGVPGNIHQGFSDCREAECAYFFAFAMGTLHTLPARHDISKEVLMAVRPMPEALMTAFASASDNFLGAEWHIVFKGKRPGIYLVW